MKSLVCSDIHDHIENFEAALMVANTSNCDSVICCGDFCAPFILDEYNKTCDLPFHAVFGNNDGDRFNLNKKSWLINNERPEGKKLHLHGEYLIAYAGHTLEGIPHAVSLAVYHYPEMASLIAASGKFDVVCYGHSHKSKIEKVNNCILVNPGSVMGYIPGIESNRVAPSCLIINWTSGELELIDLK